MKRFFFFVVVALGVIATTLTSCDKGEGDDDSITESKVVEVIHDTVVSAVHDTIEVIVYDTLVPLSSIYWFDIVKITDYYLDIGKEFSGIDDYENYVNRHGCLPVHEYIVWLGYATGRYRWWSYSINEETKRIPKNYARLVRFEEDVVIPARSYVQKLIDEGYGWEGQHFLEPEDFFEKALTWYSGEDPYGFLMIAEEDARHNMIFGI